MLLLGPGVVALSTAVVLVKLSELPTGMIATSRLLLAAMMLSPLMRLEGRTRPRRSIVELAKPVCLPGIALALHFITWFIGIRMTTAANATLIVNLSPVIMPFLLLTLVGEQVTRREILGSLLAVVGVVVLASGSARIDPIGLRGDLICLVSMVLAVLYLVLARRTGAAKLGIARYLVPLYLLAGVTTLIYTVARREWQEVSSDIDIGREMLLMALLALIPTAIGHGMLNYSMTQLRGQAVAVASLGQIPVAALLAVPLLGEHPSRAFYPACVFIAFGAVIAIFKPKVKA